MDLWIRAIWLVAVLALVVSLAAVCWTPGSVEWIGPVATTPDYFTRYDSMGHHLEYRVREGRRARIYAIERSP